MPVSHLRRAACALSVVLLASTDPGSAVSAAPAAHAEVPPVVYYRTVKVDGVDIFYREARPADAPVVLLLHGFPTSSHMFRRLIPALADHYHVIAPDYPGFGESAAPDHTTFAYTFGHYADLVDGLMGQKGVARYAMYVMDYGAPVGYRLALKHPERVSALVIQNGNAYEEGLKEFWDPIKAYWADGSDAHRQAIGVLVAPATTKFQYVDGVSDVTRIDPDNWGHDQALLDRPGNRDIQLDHYGAAIEHAIQVSVEGFDWNCPQHITPRYTVEEVATAIEPLRRQIAELQAQLAAARGDKSAPKDPASD